MQYIATLRKNMTCKRGATVLGDLKTGKAVTDPVLFEKSGVQWAGYLGEIQEANKIGMLVDLVDTDGNVDIASAMEDITALGYTAKVSTLAEAANTFTVSIETEEKAIEADTPADNDAISKKIEEIAEAGYDTKESLNKKLDVLHQWKWSDQLIENFLDRWYDSPSPDWAPVEKPRTVYVENNFDYMNSGVSLSAFVYVNLAIGKGVMLEGPKASGKGVFSETMAWLLNLPYGKTTHGRDLGVEDYLGAKTTVPSELMQMEKKDRLNAEWLALKAKSGFRLNSEQEKLLSEYNEAKAASAAVSLVTEQTALKLCSKNGGLYLADEFNLGDPNAVESVYNPLLDGSKIYWTSNDGSYPINKKFVLLAAQNTGSEYVGTTQQNAATMSRFAVVEFGYPKSIKDILKEAVNQHTKDILPAAYYKQCDDWYRQSLRKGIQEKRGFSDAALNIRGFVAALDATAEINVGKKKFKPMIPLKKNLITNVINTCPEKEREILRMSLDEDGFVTL